ncbi:hypothetical protein FQN60_016312 [Etheostoma spectabile]|uniref:G-protein coupled receptors family 1 profile domain-containing protein n=1 Tax=Etheostoma spectabile TaxID=54343 RepID=A0A5J5D3I4_9PERO|nr:hypothetical protein FQN60_016312 [Etheostoma spectabile]
MSYYEHIFFDYDFNDTSSGSGSGDLGGDLEEPCDVEHVMTANIQQVFLPVVYALIFTLGITGNGLVVIVLGCQRRLVYVGAWLPAALLAVPDLIFARTQEGGEGATLCQRFYPEDNAPLWVAVFHLQLVLVGLVIPGVVLLVCYCVIVTRLTRGPLGGQRQKRRAVRTTIALVLCFFICWLPYGVGISVDALLRLEVLPRGCSLEAVLGVWLGVAEPMAFAHCCLNPLLYAFLGAGFKSSARRALTLSRASSLKILPRRRPGASTTTESESSSLHSS